MALHMVLRKKEKKIVFVFLHMNDNKAIIMSLVFLLYPGPFRELLSFCTVRGRHACVTKFEDFAFWQNKQIFH